MNNAQSRKWMITINNPIEGGLSHDVITEVLMRFSPEYFCMADEIGKAGTFHTHVFIYSPSPMRFSTLKSRFPIAHIEKAYGSVKQNIDYIIKAGKWTETDKAETSVEGSFFDYGKPPSEKEESSPAMCKLIQKIEDGERISQIINDSPSFAFRIREIESLRQMILSERYATEIRKLDVSYIFGATGAGKTRSVFEKHNPHDICRITNYRGGKGVYFDGYSGQDVLVFEEFHSQIPIEEMLNFLDIYPLSLPARYNDKVACYTKVYITSNLPLSRQYENIQSNHPEIWKAFLRRINQIVEYRRDGSFITWALRAEKGFEHETN